MLLKALIVGINKYLENPLKCSVNDAKEIASLLEFHDNGERNFNIKLLLDENATSTAVKENLIKTFSDQTDTGVFYFSGHGIDDSKDGMISTIDSIGYKFAIRFKEIMELIKKSKCKNKIVILDCCFSGKMGDYRAIGDDSILPMGTTILTSCLGNEVSIEDSRENHSLFSNLLIEALKGGASDVLGRITPGSIYSYIDSSLSAYQQRPVFKTNVCSFVSLRNARPKIDVNEMRRLAELFDDMSSLYQLDSSYESTNYRGSKLIGKEYLKKPYYNEENGKIFDLLQRAVANGLVKPSHETHMFFAAINSDTCELTQLGKHYWYMVFNEKV